MKISKKIALALALVASVLSAFTQPTLKKLLTADEWKAAGLDRLTPAEIAVLESALLRQPQPAAPIQPFAAATPTILSSAAVAAAAPPRVTTDPQQPAHSSAIITASGPPQTEPPVAPIAASVNSSAPVVSPAQPPASTSDSRGWLNRFGLPDFNNTDWRKLPPLQAKVVSWESANRFILDNGQAWEGADPIPDELVGRAIEIHARPNNRFTLILDGKNTKVRVFRVR